MPVDFAISNRAGRILVLGRVIGNNRRKLFGFGADPQTEPVDLTDLASVIPLPTLEKITISGSGYLAAISTDTEIVVLQLAQRSVVARWKGRQASISPDGSRVAFLDENSRLAIRDVATTRSTRLLQHLGVSGVSAWSPDGRLLLTGMKTLLLSRRLAAVNVFHGTLCELAALRDGDIGEHYAWISRRLAGVFGSATGTMNERPRDERQRP
jgi:hypothetical protein